LVKELTDKLMAELLRNEELIESLRSSNPDIDKAISEMSPEKFTISKSTKNTCIEFLAENDVEISEWISNVDECERVKKILRVWFTLCKSYNKEPWCSFPEILDIDTFYPSAKVTLL
jgi:succinate dehydrogenase flavin-adding protein (antitoxin of CptAB toxin-antitoxin module)